MYVDSALDWKCCHKVQGVVSVGGERLRHVIIKYNINIEKVILKQLQRRRLIDNEKQIVYLSVFIIQFIPTERKRLH